VRLAVVEADRLWLDLDKRWVLPAPVIQHGASSDLVTAPADQAVVFSLLDFLGLHFPSYSFGL